MTLTSGLKDLGDPSYLVLEPRSGGGKRRTAGRSVSGQSCWEKRATALSFTQGDREELSRFALKRDRSVRLNIRSFSGFRELWHHKRTGGRGRGGAGLGFCSLSLSLYIPQAWLRPGAGGGAVLLLGP